MSGEYLEYNQTLGSKTDNNKNVTSDLGVGKVTVGRPEDRADVEKGCSRRTSVCDSEHLNRKTSLRLCIQVQFI
jgi:hypothetical protein